MSDFFFNSRHIYWTEWGDYPKIARADYDGRNMTVLVEDNLLWPNGVALDPEGESPSMMPILDRRINT